MTDGVRQFPCNNCGAKVVFAPGTDSLECPYCGTRTHIPDSGEHLVEHDFLTGAQDTLGEGAPTEEVISVSCGSCAALVEPLPTHEAFPCPYCGSSIVATERSQRLIKPQAVLPFRIDRPTATGMFRRWIGKLWFAPNSLKKLAELDGRLKGMYAPYWTYDASTQSQYAGMRGDNYTVTRTRTVQRDGKTVRETYQDTEIRWRPASGRVARDFDDMLVVGSDSLPRELAEALEPWDLQNLKSYADEYLSGFTAERYQIDVRAGWKRATERMDAVIRQDVRRDIGGDHQKITTLHTRHADITFKHILLPLWICSYRYNQKVYRFLVNARSGEIQGERPWSWVKISLAVVAALAVAFALYQLFGNR